VDAIRFEELLAETRAALRDGDVPAAANAVTPALALWRGLALQGLTGAAWFSAEARRLETLHVDALEEDFEVRLELGEHRALTPALRSALADNPFRERLWGQLMLALYRSGRQLVGNVPSFAAGGCRRREWSRCPDRCLLEPCSAICGAGSYGAGREGAAAPPAHGRANQSETRLSRCD
jgi:hypothetical protein